MTLIDSFFILNLKFPYLELWVDKLNHILLSSRRTSVHTSVHLVERRQFHLAGVTVRRQIVTEQVRMA